MEVDHYSVLGLPSGEEGMKIHVKEIEKAYRSQARMIHPDKNPDDPLAKSKFQKLQASFEILKNDASRNAFDNLFRAKLQRLRHESHLDAKRRKMRSDLEAREKEVSATKQVDKLREEEEKAKKNFQEEVAQIRDMIAKREAGLVKVSVNKDSEEKEMASPRSGKSLNKKMILKVSWGKNGEDYAASKLRELFQRFGEVEDVVVRSEGKRRRSALVVMRSEEAVIAATRCMCGCPSNPLLVVPLNTSAEDDLVGTANIEPRSPNVSHLIGAGYQAYEDSILRKLQKAAERQKAQS